MTMRRRWMDVLVFLEKVASSSWGFEGHMSLLGALLNLLHLIVLSRMMTSSINVIMLGIATCDICSMLTLAIFAHATVLFTNDYFQPLSRFFIHASWMAESLRDDFRRCSAWLGVLMALVRYLILKFFKYSAQLSSPAMGRNMIIGCFLSSSFLSFLYYLEYETLLQGGWTPEKACLGYVENSKFRLYYKKSSELFSLCNRFLVVIFKSVDSLVSKFIPCAAFPVLTILLCLELRRRAKNRQNAGVSASKTKENNHTTAFVISMTALFSISEFPMGASMVAMVLSTQMGVFMIADRVSFLFIIVFIFNSSIHCFLFFLMSSQYRSTVKSMLRLKRKSEIWPVSKCAAVKKMSTTSVSVH